MGAPDGHTPVGPDGPPEDQRVGVVVPDDPSELAEEAAQVRRELREAARRHRRRHRLELLLGGDPAVRLPGLVVVVAVVALFTGLLSLGVGAPRSLPALGRAHPGEAAPQQGPPLRELPALDLLDADGRAVGVRSLLPALVLLIDGCACAGMIAESAAVAPAGVSVLVVSRLVAELPPVPARGRVRALADPAAELRSLLGLAAYTRTAGVLLVSRTAAVRRSLPAADSVRPFRTDLARLAPPRAATTHTATTRTATTRTATSRPRPTGAGQTRWSSTA